MKPMNEGPNHENPESPLQPGQGWRQALRYLWWAQIIAMSGMSMVTPFLPFVIQDMGIPDGPELREWVGILISVNFLVAALIAPYWGRLADRFGRKPMALRAVFGLGVAVGLMSLARNVYDLLALRIFQGSLGGFIAASISLLAAQTPKAQLGYALGSLNSAVMAGNLIGPLIGGVLANLLGYRGLFLAIAVGAIGSGILVWMKVEEPPRITAGRGPSRTFWETLGDLSHFPEMRLAFVSQFLVYTATMTITPVLPIYVGAILGPVPYLPTAVGLVIAGLGLPCVLFGPSWGKLGDRIGMSLVLLITICGLALSAPLFILATGLGGLFASRFLMGFFLAGCAPAGHSLVAGSMPAYRQATALSLLATAQLIGNTTGPLLGGYLSAHAGFPWVFACATFLFALAGVWVWRCRNRSFGSGATLVQSPVDSSKTGSSDREPPEKDVS